MPADRILIATVGAPHGVRGEVRLRVFTEDPLAVARYGPLRDDEGRVHEILRVRPAKTVVIAALKGISDRDAAEALRGRNLYADRDRMPVPDDETFYQADLIGLEAVTAEGLRLGRVIAVHNFGAGDLLEIAPEGRNGELLPFTRDFVPDIDVAAGRLTVAPPAGLFDAAARPPRSRR
jgi:16S rRNA processing protein RimM